MSLLGACFFAAFVVGFAYATWAMVCRAGRCPSAETLDNYAPHETSKLYATDGQFMAELGLERRTIVRFPDIPPLLWKAIVVTEDKRFYRHAGIDWHAGARRAIRRHQEPHVQRRLLHHYDAARSQHLSRQDFARQDAHSENERGQGRA